MEHRLDCTKTYRYETNNCKNPKQILFVLHGYGQLSKFFIRKFEALSEETLIVAPEGMHRFYLKGSSGRVGASWMTKEAREDDIKDNINWLNKLYQRIMDQHGNLNSYLLGFSQGGATAARWQANGNVDFKSIALWACVFPPDLKIEEVVPLQIPSYFVIGSNDEFYDELSQNKLIHFYKSVDYQIIRYDGVHDIQNETLLNLFRQMKM